MSPTVQNVAQRGADGRRLGIDPRLREGAALVEIKASDTDEIVGTVSIGAGETPAFRFVARAAEELHRRNPKLCFSVS